MVKRILTLFLCFAIVLSILSQSALGAGSFGNDLITDTASVTAWNTWLDSNLYVQVSLIADKPQFWDEFDRAILASGAGSCGRNDDLMSACDNWNGSFVTFLNPLGSLWFKLFSLVFTGKGIRPVAEVAYDDTFGVYRLREVNTKLWIVNSSGHFPYYKSFSEGASGGGFPERIGQWRKVDAIKDNQALWHVVIGSDLSAYKENWADERSSVISQADGDFFWLVSTVNGVRYVLCDDYGYPYYVPKDKQTAVTTPNNYYTEEGDTVNVYDDGSAIVGSIVDVQNGILNVGGQAYYIDDLTYDASSKTYFVDSHDAYTFNQTTNNYTTNNYHWEIQYNIDYTSVTYIGQTEEYEEEYRYYYQLPDGRSSADLTAEDLEQLSVAFADVVNYARSADNANLRALYHFDGNTQDSSYWSYCTDFKWNSGASLTYMDEGVFGGSLYLDETEHDFSITLPNAFDLSSDFTVQFRYYQSHTEAPTKDSYVSFGDSILMWFTGSEFLSPSGKVLASTPVGTWNEICFVRKGDTFGYYLNGVCLLSSANTAVFSPVIKFSFGGSQQTYKKIDELRVTRGAIYTPGENYECSAVPFDTNLTLILPDGERPMADEVAVFVSENNILDRYDLDDWSDPDFISKLKLYAPPDGSSKEYMTYYSGAPDSYSYFYNPAYTTVSAGTDGLTLTCTYASPYLMDHQSSNGYYYDLQCGGIFLPLSRNQFTAGSFNQYKFAPDLKTNTTYCLTVVMADGSSSSISFSFDRYCAISTVSSNDNTILRLSTGMIRMMDASYSTPLMRLYGIFITFDIIDFCDFYTTDIVYAELVEGTEPQYEIAYETAMYSSGELDSSPVLAVRSNQPISGYQIGGVRPSYPEKGQVWAMVENSRMVSLQQYTGSIWLEVDGRIWTGIRWIPYSSFDVFLLRDCYDIQGTVSDPDYEYIYSESGFWAWFQRQWLAFMAKLDQILLYLKEFTGISQESDCEHVYTSKVTEPNCSTPGGAVYTCKHCGDVILESVPALGHDWVIVEDVPSEFELPDDVHCPGCNAVDFTYELNAEQDEFTCICSVCAGEWTETPIVTWGHTVSECTRCGVTQTESKEPGKDGFFSALGSFIADGIVWILDKLTQLVEAISGIQDAFKAFADRMKENVGQFPAFLSAAIAVLPGDLMDVIWFAVIALIAVAVYKKITR